MPSPEDNYLPRYSPAKLKLRLLWQYCITLLFITGDIISVAIPSGYAFELLFGMAYFWWTLALTVCGELISSALFYAPELLRNIRDIEKKSTTHDNRQHAPWNFKMRSVLYQIANGFFLPLELIKTFAENYLLATALWAFILNWGSKNPIEFHDIDPEQQQIILTAVLLISSLDASFEVSSELYESSKALTNSLKITQQPFYALLLLPLTKFASLLKAIAVTGSTLRALWLTAAMICYLPPDKLGRTFQEYPVLTAIITTIASILIVLLATIPIYFKYYFFEGKAAQDNLNEIKSVWRHSQYNTNYQSNKQFTNKAITTLYKKLLKYMLPLVKWQWITLCNGSFGIFAWANHSFLRDIEDRDLRRSLALTMAIGIGFLMAIGIYYSQVKPAAENMKRELAELEELEGIQPVPNAESDIKDLEKQTLLHTNSTTSSSCSPSLWGYSPIKDFFRRCCTYKASYNP